MARVNFPHWVLLLSGICVENYFKLKIFGLYHVNMNLKMGMKEMEFLDVISYGIEEGYLIVMHVVYCLNHV
jgi:hypothetical protein